MEEFVPSKRSEATANDVFHFGSLVITGLVVLCCMLVGSLGFFFWAMKPEVQNIIKPEVDPIIFAAMVILLISVSVALIGFCIQVYDQITGCSSDKTDSEMAEFSSSKGSKATTHRISSDELPVTTRCILAIFLFLGLVFLLLKEVKTGIKPEADPYKVFCVFLQTIVAVLTVVVCCGRLCQLMTAPTCCCSEAAHCPSLEVAKPLSLV